MLKYEFQTIIFSMISVLSFLLLEKKQKNHDAVFASGFEKRNFFLTPTLRGRQRLKTVPRNFSLIFCIFLLSLFLTSSLPLLLCLFSSLISDADI